MRAVLLPVKNSTRAKQRLSGFLSGSERRLLVEAMLEDVSSAVEAALLPERRILVTSDRNIAKQFQTRNWEVLQEKEQLSESSSVDLASSLLQAQGISSLLRLPGDIPGVRSRDIDSIFEEGELDSAPIAVLVPSRAGDGTNALLRSPPDIFPSRFGPGSFDAHCQEAHSRGIQTRILTNEYIALDLDEPRDLLDFQKLQLQTRTFAFLKKILNDPLSHR